MVSVRLLLSALMIVGGIASIAAVAVLWVPCVEAPTYDSRVCMLLQTDFSPPWLLPIWFVSVFAVVGYLVLARATGRRTAGSVLALGALALGFLLFDYVLTPAFNGGYSSHDSPPGHGIWSSAWVAVAGILLLVDPHRSAGRVATKGPNSAAVRTTSGDSARGDAS